MVDPHFTMLWNEDIPRVTEKDKAGKITQLTLASGAYKGETPPSPPPDSWASDDRSDLAIWTIRMEAGATYELPAVREGTHRSLYLHAGDGGRVAGKTVADQHRVEFVENGPIELKAGPIETEFLLLQGRPIAEPVAKRGPFVMNTQDEIRQAYSDFQQTQFGGWPWPDNGPVHAGTKGRFARHIDGRFEEPT
jgi:redox-sensitive bicupin YhaK (pirin superfamily)